MTARELGLGYYALKKRAALSTAAVPAVTLAPVPPLGFVEVPLATKGSGAACTLDLEDRRGTHLRVKLEGSSTESAEAIACALWSAR
ncbi:MAG: hypothetical protein GY733_08385 [bacterium]|nr:hypothetical protein [bacterium]